jgi:hypothetical protein
MEPDPLARRGIDSLVVGARRFDPDEASTGRDRTGLGVPVAHHQPPAPLITLISVRLDVRVDLRLQRGSQHAPSALAHDPIEHRRRVLARRLVGHYSHIGVPSSSAFQRQ